MKKISRRQFANAAALGAGALAFPNIAFGAKPKVVVRTTSAEAKNTTTNKIPTGELRTSLNAAENNHTKCQVSEVKFNSREFFAK